MIEQAIEYANRGWAIFPCIPNGKKPLIENWQTLATTNIEQIRRWWADNPSANIGFPTGIASGIAVIDVDVSDKGNGFRELEALDIDGWETAYQQTPRGGRHFFFKMPQATVGNSVGFFGKGSCVDVRGEGGYVLLSPSVTSNGTYKFEDMDLDDFPKEFIREERAKTTMPDVKHIHVPEKALKCATRVEEALAYLRTCKPAIQGESGHSTLLSVCHDLVWGFVLKADEAIDLLWREYNARCVPPWNVNDKEESRDFERKVYEAFRFPPPVAGTKLSVIKSDMNKIADALLGGKMDVDKLGEPEPEKVINHRFTPNYKPSVKTINIPKSSDPVATMFRDYEHGLSKDELSKPPGIVGELAVHITETAGKPQPFLSLGAALTAQSAIMGRLYADVDGTRTNMYCIGVAPSSAGKDHPTKMVDRLFVQAGAEQMLGGSDLTSDTALVRAIMDMQYKSGYFLVWDECGHIITNIRKGSHGGASSTVVPVLMKLYSSANDVFRSKMKADNDHMTIPYPHVSLWGVTTPESLFTTLDGASMRDGFLGRIMPFVSTLEPVYLSGRGRDYPRHIISHFAREFEKTKNAISLQGLPQISTIHYHPEAAEMGADFCRKCEEMKVRINNDHSYLWGKAFENCRKIALTVAGGCDDRMVTPEIMHFAIDLTRLLVIEYQMQADKHIFESEYEKAVKSIYEKLSAKFGTKPFKRSDLTRLTQYLPPKVRGEYRDDFLSPDNDWITLHEDNTFTLNAVGSFSAITNKKKKGQ